MEKAGPVEGGSGRLAAHLAATLDPKLQDALDHPVRREVLRAFHGKGRSRSVAEIGARLPVRAGQLSYHLRVLRDSGTIVPEPAGVGIDRGRARYASEVCGDRDVRSVLRATERWDREQTEALARANASPLLAMFRLPRPVRTIRLRGRARSASGPDSE
jgi:DNA-binding transcriptional ArsR family regulator